MFILLVIIAIVVLCVISTKKSKEKRDAEKAEIKERMMNDSFILTYSLAIVKSLTDLKNASVQMLRCDGRFYLLFRNGSVYYETRWLEGSGDDRRTQKNTQCLLDRLKEGKNPLSEIEDEVFAEIVEDALVRIPWISVSLYGREIEVRKAAGATIPEVE